MQSYKGFHIWLYVYIIIGALSMISFMLYEFIVFLVKIAGICLKTPVDRKVLDKKWNWFRLATQAVGIIGLASASGLGTMISSYLAGLDVPLLEDGDKFVFILKKTDAIMIAHKCSFMPYKEMEQTMRKGRLWAASIDTGVAFFSAFVAYVQHAEAKLASSAICLGCLVAVLGVKIMILILVGVKFYGFQVLTIIASGFVAASSIAPFLHRLSGIFGKKRRNDPDTEGINSTGDEGSCDQTLQSYGMEGHIVHLSTTAAGGNTQAVDTNGSGVFGAGSSELKPMNQPLVENPDLYRDSIIMSLIKHPEITETMVKSNPLVGGMMEEYPGMTQALKYQATLHRTPEEASRNFEVMMSNVEAYPDGFNVHSRRKDEAVKEPILNAGGNSGGLGCQVQKKGGNLKEHNMKRR